MCLARNQDYLLLVVPLRSVVHAVGHSAAGPCEECAHDAAGPHADVRGRPQCERVAHQQQSELDPGGEPQSCSGVPDALGGARRLGRLSAVQLAGALLVVPTTESASVTQKMRCYLWLSM